MACSKEIRIKVAELATDLYEGKIDFNTFVHAYNNLKIKYDSGDEACELFDLIEHEPKVGGFFGVSKDYHENYIRQINNLINKLKS